MNAASIQDTMIPQRDINYDPDHGRFICSVHCCVQHFIDVNTAVVYGLEHDVLRIKAAA